MTFCRVEHVWENSTLGTRPFVAGLWVEASIEPNAADLFTLTADVVDAYDDHLKVLQAEQLGAGKVVATWYGEDEILQDERTLPAPTGGGNIRNAGFSLRTIFLAPRPPGARPNSCYWPYIDTAWYGITGATQGGIEGVIADWSVTLIANLNTSAFEWVARHFIEDDARPDVANPVSGATAANSVSFLQRRYR